jgi:hypothetical protein
VQSAATPNSASFSDLSGLIILSTDTTNWLHSGGATNVPSRYYRVRLVP